MLSLQPFPFVDNTCLILVFLSEACLMCCADAAWKNKKIYDSLWQCLDKMQNERDKFLQNCLLFYRNIHKFWLIFKKIFTKFDCLLTEMFRFGAKGRGKIGNSAAHRKWPGLTAAHFVLHGCRVGEKIEGKNCWMLGYKQDIGFGNIYFVIAPWLNYLKDQNDKDSAIWGLASEEAWSDYVSMECITAKELWSQLRWCGSQIVGKRSVLNNCTIKHTSSLIHGLVSLYNLNITCPLGGLWHCSLLCRNNWFCCSLFSLTKVIHITDVRLIWIDFLEWRVGLNTYLKSTSYSIT